MLLYLEAAHQVQFTIEIGVFQFPGFVTIHFVPPDFGAGLDIAARASGPGQAGTSRCRWVCPQFRQSLCKTFLPTHAEPPLRETPPAIPAPPAGPLRGRNFGSGWSAGRPPRPR